MLNGRKEHEEKLRINTLKSLESYPIVLVKFFEESAGSTQSSKSNYLHTAKRFVDFMISERKVNMFIDKSWDEVTRRDIIEFIKDTRTCKGRKNFGKENKPKTSWEHVLRIRCLFDYLLREGFVSQNPVPPDKDFEGFIPTENPPMEVVYMTPEEVKSVREHIIKTSKQAKRDVCIFMLGCRFGIRETAMSNINVEDIYLDDEGEYVLEVNDKGNDFRKCFLDDDSLFLIRDYLEERGGNKEEGPLFTRFYSPTERLSPTAINDVVKKYTAFLPKHITAHKMRSTCITNMYNYSGDIYEAARRGGHHNIENTKKYINTKEKDRKTSKEFVKNVY